MHLSHPIITCSPGQFNEGAICAPRRRGQQLNQQRERHWGSRQAKSDTATAEQEQLQADVQQQQQDDAARMHGTILRPCYQLHSLSRQ